MISELVTIVIPIFEEHISENEKISLQNASVVFNNWPIVLIAPEGLDTSFYDKSLSITHKNYIFKFFPLKYFKGIEGYNRLMMSHDFYCQFEETQYILIHQLDAYVFRDELNKWCNLGYDYIGAPWLINENNQLSLEEYAGNGGFSLRRVSSFLITLETQNKIIYNPMQIIKQYRGSGLKKIVYKTPLIVARFFGFRNNTKYYIRINTIKEDIFWAYVAPLINRKFKSIRGIDAIDFGFDKYPSYLYELNSNKLPFGCHGWFKNESSFWDNFIKIRSKIA